jgi:hypothetical protein
MNALREIVRGLARIVVLLQRPSDFFRGLRQIARAICRIIRHLVRLEPLPSAARDDCCVEMPDVYHRPDPLLYAQYYLMDMGLSVTWDNPDIELFEPDPSAPDGLGAAVRSSDLEKAHLYKVRVRVWNGSYDAPAAGLPVHLSFLSFGVGTTSTPIASRQVDLGVKGSPHQPVFAVFDWRTPPEEGHFCLQARLEWFDDANPDNNLGQENVEVGVAHSPAEFDFTLRNDAWARRQFVLEADAYRLPELPPCDEEAARLPARDRDAKAAPSRLAESRARWAVALRDQGYGAFPLPPEWTISITPSELVLEEGEEQTIRVSVDPGALESGAEAAVNVHTFAAQENERELVGGVTFYVSGA